MKKIKLIKDLNESDLIHLCNTMNFPKFHGTQIYKWLFHKKCNSIDDMSDIPLDLKNKIKNKFKMNSLKVFRKNKSKVDNTIVVSTTNDKRQSRERHGLSRSLVANMVQGLKLKAKILLSVLVIVIK